MNGPRIIVDDRTPNQATVYGIVVPLQHKQYQLLRLLIQNVPACVPYGEIYAELWGKTIVEDNQMHYQRRKLVQALEKHVPMAAGLIKTYSKVGFALACHPMDACLVRRDQVRPANVVPFPRPVEIAL